MGRDAAEDAGGGAWRVAARRTLDAAAHVLQVLAVVLPVMAGFLIMGASGCGGSADSHAGAARRSSSGSPPRRSAPSS